MSTQAPAPALARQAAELAALIVDAMQVYVGRDIRDVWPTVAGPMVEDAQGRAWLLHLVPEADVSDDSDESRDST